MAERQYTPAELRRFLTAIDGGLEKPFRLNLMGGSAIAIAYGIDRNTTDIDTFDTKLRGLRAAIASAHESTGLDIAVSDAGGKVGDVPLRAEARMVRALPRLPRLQIFALEKHDVALSKAIRGEAKDFASLEQLHAKSPLQRETLVLRYLGEMNHVAGNDRAHDERFEELVSRLFGEVAAEEVGETLRARRRRRTPAKPSKR